MNRTATILLTGVYLLLLSGCDDTNSPTGTEPPDKTDPTAGVICLPDTGAVLYPLAEGNYWLIEVKGLVNGVIWRADTFKTVIAELRAATYSDTGYCVGVEDYYYDYKDETPLNVRRLYWNGPEGLYFMGGMSSTDTLVQPKIRFRYPVEVGENWVAPHLLYYTNEEQFLFTDDSLGANIRCVAVNEPFKTPLGTFNCTVYAYSLSQGDDVLAWAHYFVYYSPGIGKVGVEKYASFNTFYSWAERNIVELKVRQELIDYHLLEWSQI